MINNDSINTTATTTIIHEEIPLTRKPRRSSIFKPMVIVLASNNDVDEGSTKEYESKVSEEFENWRELYVDIKNEYCAIKDIHSKTTEVIDICSEDYSELLAKSENYLKKANDFFDQMNCISAMNQNAIALEQSIAFQLELQKNIIKENMRNPRT